MVLLTPARWPTGVIIHRYIHIECKISNHTLHKLLGVWPCPTAPPPIYPVPVFIHECKALPIGIMITLCLPGQCVLVAWGGGRMVISHTGIWLAM